MKFGTLIQERLRKPVHALRTPKTGSGRLTQPKPVDPMQIAGEPVAFSASENVRFFRENLSYLP